MLLDYDTVIFDLDFNVWDGCKPLFWAKLLKPPYRLEHNRLYDTEDNFIQLQDGVADVIKVLYVNGKNIGFATRGGLENVEFDKQPPVIALKEFDLYRFFNYQKIVLFKTGNKATLLKPLGKTLYIDDNEYDLNQVVEAHGNAIDVINRNSFTDWWSTI